MFGLKTIFKKESMQNYIFRFRFQLLLILLGFIWILFLNECLQISQQNIIFNDSENYKEAAHLLYYHFKSHYFRPLGMAMISGLPYIFGGNDQTVYRFSLILNCCCWLGSALLLFAILKKQLSAHRAFLFSLLYFSILGCVCINFHLLTESIFTFLLLLAAYFLQKYESDKSFCLLAVAIGVLLFAVLIKPAAKFLVIVTIFYFGKTLIQNFGRKSAIFVYFGLCLIAFQYVKMKQDYGNFTLSYIDGVTYYNYLGSKAMCLKTNMIFDQNNNKRASVLEKLPFEEQRILAERDLLFQIKNNMYNVVKAYFSNVSENTKTGSGCIEVCQNLEQKVGFENNKKIFFWVSKFQNKFLTIVGFILALFNFFRFIKKDIFVGFISFCILYFVAISGISCGQGDRFHIVFFPFVIILMANFLKKTTFKWSK